MRTILIAALAALLMTAEAQAYCIVLPEESAWQGAERQIAQTLCLQRAFPGDRRQSRGSTLEGPVQRCHGAH